MRQMRRLAMAALIAVGLLGGCGGTPKPKETAQSDMMYFLTTTGDFDTLTNKVFEAFKAAGYTMGENRDMVTPYKKQFGETHVAHYNLLTVHHIGFVSKIAQTESDIALFSPFILLTYEKDGKFYAGFLRPTFMAKIIGAKSGMDLFKAYEDKSIAALQSALPGAAEHRPDYPVKNSGKPYVVKVVTEMDEDADPADKKFEMQMIFEDGLAPYGFIIANFNNLAYELSEKAGDESFEFMDTYSICKLPVIYNVSKSRPEAGVFAPCSLAMYKKAGSPEVVIAYPSVENWIDHLGVTDETSLAELKEAQEQIKKVIGSAAE